MRHREETYMSGNLTAMIDVVFQLIIFFVCTINIQEASDPRIELAMAPNGQATTTKNKYEVRVDVDKSGRIEICRTVLSPSMLTTILKKSRADANGHDVPVLIRADAKTKHAAVRKVMDACSAAGIWKIKFTALKEKA